MATGNLMGAWGSAYDEYDEYIAPDSQVSLFFPSLFPPLHLMCRPEVLSSEHFRVELLRKKKLQIILEGVSNLRNSETNMKLYG